jgi:hypothetical protein
VAGGTNKRCALRQTPGARPLWKAFQRRWRPEAKRIPAPRPDAGLEKDRVAGVQAFSR